MDEEIKGSEANCFPANCTMSFFATLDTGADKTRLLTFFIIFFFTLNGLNGFYVLMMSVRLYSYVFVFVFCFCLFDGFL